MKYLQAHNKGHDEEGYGNSSNNLCRLRPSLCMVDNANENKECQRHHIEQREQTFVVYFGEDKHICKLLRDYLIVDGFFLFHLQRYKKNRK